MEFRKMLMITLHAEQKKRHRCTDVQNRFLDSVGEGEGGMFWENGIETSILSRVKQITSPGWMHETSAQGWCTGFSYLLFQALFLFKKVFSGLFLFVK